ncbi:cysteine-rich receptor-like protein kinase 26 [Tanacetum coccineum]
MRICCGLLLPRAGGRRWVAMVAEALLPTDHLESLWPRRDVADLFVAAIHGARRWCSVGDVGSLDIGVALQTLFDDLIPKAAAGNSLLKFAAWNVTGPDFTSIYGLVQCSPDILYQQCNDCLIDALNNFSNIIGHSGKIGGRALLPMCNFRYENYPFLNRSTSIPPSSPPPRL